MLMSKIVLLPSMLLLLLLNVDIDVDVITTTLLRSSAQDFTTYFRFPARPS